MDNGKKSKTKKNKTVKWYRIYYLLACFDVLIVVCGLFLNHHLISVQRQSVNDNEVWVNRLDKYLALRNTANKVSQPGDDVFASHDPVLERRNMESYLAKYNDEFKILFDQKSEISPRFREHLTNDLSEIDENVKAMANQCRKVLDFYDIGDEKSAGAEMAKMDQMLGKVNDNLSILHSDVIQIQHDLLTEESDYVSGIQKYEIVTAVFVLLMVLIAVLYGGWIKKRIEEAAEEHEKNIKLEASNDYIKNIVGSMIDLMITVDDNGLIANVNKAFLTKTGYREDEVVGQPASILTGEKTFLTEEEYQQMIRESNLVEIEKDLITKNGETFRCSISSSLLKDYKTSAVIVAVDITQRIEDERRLRKYAAKLEQSNREFEELTNSYRKMVEDLGKSRTELTRAHDFTENMLNSMMDFVVVLDMDFNVTRINPSALKLNGYEEHELIGRSVNTLIAERPFTQKGLETLRNAGGKANLIKNNLCKDGSIVPITLSTVILKDENGEECGIVCVGKDISEIIKARDNLQRSNERLRRSNRELQDFAYVASHDLQEPLRKVQAFGDRLQKKFADSLNEEGKDYISRMQNAAGRMQTLINDLLTFSRVTSKAQPFKSVDVKEIAGEVVSDLEVRIEQTGGKVEIGDLPTIDADPVQMRQLLQNLIGNALKFHRPDETPIVKIYAETALQQNESVSAADDNNLQTVGSGKQICKIVVQDNGIGFEEKYLDKVFTVFQRLHGRSEYEGSGIGLAVCRKIVERHGGAITARSELNKGSTFFVTLPLAQINEEINVNE